MGTKTARAHSSSSIIPVVEDDVDEIVADIGTGNKRSKSPSGNSDKSDGEEPSLLDSLPSGESGATNVVQRCLCKVNILNYQIQ